MRVRNEFPPPMALRHKVRRSVAIATHTAVVWNVVIGLDASAALATCKVRNINTGERYGGTGENLQDAIREAAFGDNLHIKGVCSTGRDRPQGFEIPPQELTLVGVSTERFPTPTLSGDGHARVLLITGAHVTIRDLVITRGLASSGAGIRVRDGSTLMLTGTTVVSRNEAELGGGIHIAQSALVMEGSATVRANTSEDGGGVYVGPGSSMTLGGSASVARNMGLVWAGGIEVREATLLLKDTSSVVGNRSGNGAGIASYRSSLVLNDSVAVARNVAAALAGGIHVGADTTLQMNGTASVRGNGARKGGGIGLFGAEELVLHDLASVTDNTARRRGGGIYTHLTPVYVCSGAVAISPNDPDVPPPTIPCV